MFLFLYNANHAHAEINRSLHFVGEKCFHLIPGGIPYNGRFLPKGVPFSGFRFMKG